MKQIQPLTFTLAVLFLAGTLARTEASVVTSFTGDFAPGNWTEAGTAGDAIAFGNNSFEITAPADEGNYAEMLFITPAQGPYTLSFDWQMENYGDSGNPVAYYAVMDGGTVVSGGSSFPLTGNGANGTVSAIEIPAGDELIFTFSGSGTEMDKNPAEFSVVTVVPEANTWVAVVFLAGVVTVTGLRRKFAGTTGSKA